MKVNSAVGKEAASTKVFGAAAKISRVLHRMLTTFDGYALLAALGLDLFDLFSCKHNCDNSDLVAKLDHTSIKVQSYFVGCLRCSPGTGASNMQLSESRSNLPKLTR